MIELGVSNASPGVPRGWFRRARRACGAALALAGCVGFLPQPAPSADLSTIRLPPGFAIEFFARDLGYPRFMALDPRGTLLVSVPRAGRVIALPDDNRDGRADAVVPVVEGLELPHGLAFLDGQLYVAETGRVVRFDYDPATRRVARRRRRSSCRTSRPAAATGPGPSPSGPIAGSYVSVGSSCNSCEERDRRRAAIYRYDADGRAGAPFATGLRNAVGIAFRPGTAELWATVNGRDWLGDDRPARVRHPGRGGRLLRLALLPLDAGGASCPTPISAAGDRCKAARRPSFLYQAHTAPLGLAFYTGSQFPAGVSRRSLRRAPRLLEPRGARRLQGDPGEARRTPRRSRRTSRRAGSPAAATGAGPWTSTVAPDGALFLSDDSLGAVYRITYRGG